MLGCNMFCYCLNNPVNMVDESGCVSEWLKKIWSGTKEVGRKIISIGAQIEDCIAELIDSILSPAETAQTVGSTVDGLVEFFINIPDIKDKAIYIHTLNIIGLYRNNDYKIVDIGVYDSYNEYVNTCKAELDGVVALCAVDTDLYTKLNSSVLSPTDIDDISRLILPICYRTRGKIATHVGGLMVREGVGLLKTAWGQIA